MNKSARILVVDDEPDTVEILSRQLGLENYKILKAYSGKESLALLKKHKPDLILMDITMPEMDGFETIRIIRDTAKEFIPIIIVTASKDDTESITRGFAVGANDYIVIPCNKEELLARIRAMLRIKELNDALRESETNYRTLFTNAAEGIVAADLQTKQFRYANPAVCRMFGYTEGEFVRLGMADMHPKESLARVFAEFEAQAQGKKELAYNLPCRRKDGALFYADVNATMIVLNGHNCNVGFFTDVTERKQAEMKLAASEERYRQLIENTNDIIYSLTPEGLFTFVSSAWRRLLGHVPAEVVGHSFAEFVHPDDLPSCYAFLQKVVKSRERQEGVEYRVRHKNGEWRWHTSSAAPVKDAAGAATGYDGLARDITERKQAEAKAVMLADAIETAHHGCLIVSTDYKVVFGNDYAMTKLGFDPVELTNIDLFSICTDREQIKDIIETMKVTRRWMGEIAIIKKDGGQFPALVSVTALGEDDDASGRDGNVILFQDITIQKEMREKLLTSEKLAVMGRLTADVAHELNNPLAIVIGGTQLVLSRMDEKAQTTFKSQLETVLRNARRCKTILSNLLGYGRTIGRKEEAVNLPDLIREAIDDVNYQHDMSAIETVLNYSEFAVAEITGNRSALLSVFVNLIRNARQAMGEKGRLTVTIEKEDAKHLRIDIRDTGIGMNKEQKTKLFKPFVSGWKEGEGSGLGLATSLGIIETHGGSISAESAGEGKGATFTIILPCEFKEKK